MNTETLDEFDGDAFVNPDYLPKIFKWIDKKNFNVINTENPEEFQL